VGFPFRFWWCHKPYRCFWRRKVNTDEEKNNKNGKLENSAGRNNGGGRGSTKGIIMCVLKPIQYIFTNINCSTCTYQNNEFCNFIYKAKLLQWDGDGTGKGKKIENKEWGAKKKITIRVVREVAALTRRC
jgi:hypothetical protein